MFISALNRRDAFQLTNWALAANGGAADASSSYGAEYPASSVINGNRTIGSPSAFWADDTASAWPDWLLVYWSPARMISKVDVFTLQDGTNIEPTLDTTFSLYGITEFDVQYWNGSSYTTITSVTGNNKVWRSFTFPEVSTTGIRILVNASLATYSRIVELEAWGY